MKLIVICFQFMPTDTGVWTLECEFMHPQGLRMERNTNAHTPQGYIRSQLQVVISDRANLVLIIYEKTYKPLKMSCRMGMQGKRSLDNLRLVYIRHPALNLFRQQAQAVYCCILMLCSWGRVGGRASFGWLGVETGLGSLVNPQKAYTSLRLQR